MLTKYLINLCITKNYFVLNYKKEILFIVEIMRNLVGKIINQLTSLMERIIY